MNFFKEKHGFPVVKIDYAISQSHYDVTSKQIYCLNAKNHFGKGYTANLLINEKVIKKPITCSSLKQNVPDVNF